MFQNQNHSRNGGGQSKKMPFQIIALVDYVDPTMVLISATNERGDVKKDKQSGNPVSYTVDLAEMRRQRREFSHVKLDICPLDVRNPVRFIANAPIHTKPLEAGMNIVVMSWGFRGEEVEDPEREYTGWATLAEYLKCKKDAEEELSAMNSVFVLQSEGKILLRAPLKVFMGKIDQGSLTLPKHQRWDKHDPRQRGGWQMNIGMPECIRALLEEKEERKASENAGRTSVGDELVEAAGGKKEEKKPSEPKLSRADRRKQAQAAAAAKRAELGEKGAVITDVAAAVLGSQQSSEEAVIPAEEETAVAG